MMDTAGGSTTLATPDAACSSEIRIPAPSIAVNLTLAGCSLIMLAFCLAVHPPGSMHSAGPLIVATLVLAAPMLVPAAYWHQKGNAEKRDAALMLPWAMVLAALVAQMAATAATFVFPLRDTLWHNLDLDLGIRVPAIMAWAARHPSVQGTLAYCYDLIHPMMLVAILLPPIIGKRKAAEQYILGNGLGFIIGLPFMVFLPAIGPWVTWHFAPNLSQGICESSILILRKGSIPTDGLFGATVCLPSFHTFWAVLSAQALWPFRLLRYPAIVLAALIVASTLTTGWHYGVDVIAGLLLAALCIALANWIISIGR
jgi:membrane-associated phospholipid phosphatase